MQFLQIINLPEPSINIMSHGKIREDRTCLSCRHPLESRFGFHCGQKNTELKQPLHYLFTHFIEDISFPETRTQEGSDIDTFTKTIVHSLPKAWNLPVYCTFICALLYVSFTNLYKL